MEAKQKQGMAQLEEFLQEKYVESYENLSNKDNKAIGLATLPGTSGYFYKPPRGGLNYVVDKDGHALYLIIKSNLPNEIKEGLVGGDAGKGEYSDYAGLNDVYGVTSNLKVYYCQSGIDSIKGLAKEELDLDDPAREVFPANSPFANLLTGRNDKNVRAEEVKNIPDLEIDGTQIQSLEDLYNLTSLQELILKNYNGSLVGVENCLQLKKIRLESCKITDYSSIGKLGNRLERLYLYDVTNEEVGKLTSKSGTGIGTYDLENLKYFGVVGNVCSLDCEAVNSSFTIDKTKSENKITETTGEIVNFDNLTKKTKNAVHFLYLNNNELINLKGFINYNNVETIRLEYNNLVTLDGMQNMSLIKYLMAFDNQLGKNESAESRNETTDALSYLNKSLSQIIYLNLQINQIRFIDYVKNMKTLQYLYLSDNGNFNYNSVSEIADLYNGILSTRKNIDNEKYGEYLSTSENMICKNLETTTEEGINKVNYLKNLDPTKKAEVKYLDLSGSQIIDSDFTAILTGFSGLIELNCNGCTYLSTLDWLNGKNNLAMFLFNDTNVIGDEVSNLDKYATNLKAFQCNNPEIDLTKMQKTISRSSVYNGKNLYHGWLGAGIKNSSLVDRLEECTDLTYICTLGMGDPSDGSLDFSNCKSLERMYYQYGAEIILPSNFKGFEYFFMLGKRYCRF